MNQRFHNSRSRFKMLGLLSLSACFLPCAAFGQTQELDCLIEPEMSIELGTSVDGIVETIDVDKSDYVERGATLVTLESSVEQAAVDLARERANMRQTILAKEVNAAYALRQRDRVRELHKKKAASKADRDQAETDAKLARLELETAKNNQTLAKLELRRAIAALELRSIKSPVSGIIVNRHVNPGESVEDTPILKIAQIDPLRIEIIAPRNLFGQVKKGMVATIYPEAPATGRYTAKVSVVDGIVDAASGTFGIRLTVPNPDRKLFGGLKCRAQLGIGKNTADANGPNTLHEPLLVQAND